MHLTARRVRNSLKNIPTLKDDPSTRLHPVPTQYSLSDTDIREHLFSQQKDARSSIGKTL